MSSNRTIANTITVVIKPMATAATVMSLVIGFQPSAGFRKPITSEMANSHNVVSVGDRVASTKMSESDVMDYVFAEASSAALYADLANLQRLNASGAVAEEIALKRGKLHQTQAKLAELDSKAFEAAVLSPLRDARKLIDAFDRFLEENADFAGADAPPGGADPETA